MAELRPAPPGVRQGSDGYRPGPRIPPRAALALAVAVLLLGAGAMVSYRLYTRQTADTPVINLAGRQRALSQKLAKEILLLSRSGTLEQRLRYREAARSTAAEWTRVQRGLRRADPALNLRGPNPPPVRRLFVRIEPHFRAIREAVAHIVALPDEKLAALEADDPAVQRIARASGPYLELMDRIVAQYERAAREHVRRLRWVQAAALAVPALLALVALPVLLRRLRCDGRPPPPPGAGGSVPAHPHRNP